MPTSFVMTRIVCGRRKTGAEACRAARGTGPTSPVAHDELLSRLPEVLRVSKTGKSTSEIDTDGDRLVGKTPIEPAMTATASPVPSQPTFPRAPVRSGTPARLCAAAHIRHDQGMTTQTTKLRHHLRNALATPFDADASQQTRTTFALLILTGGLISIAAIVGLFSWLFVGLPQTIVTGSFGQVCVTGIGLDCARAIADARQAVLLVLGGFLGIIGIVFSYLRWRAERDNTDEAIAEGTRAKDRHVREGEQLEITRITDALSLLESGDRTKKVAAISLLTDYAIHAKEERNAKLIINVLEDYVRSNTPGVIEYGNRTPPDSPPVIEDLPALALKSLLRASSARAVRVDLSERTLIGLHAPDSVWTYANLTQTQFIDCQLSRAHFGGEEARYFGLVFDDCRMSQVKFSDCTLEFVRFRASNEKEGGHTMQIDDARFVNAHCLAVAFDGISAAGASFSGGTMHNVSFTRSRIEGVSFDRCKLVNLSLAEAKFSRGSVNITNSETIVLKLGDHQQDVQIDGGPAPLIGEHPARARDSGKSPGR